MTDDTKNGVTLSLLRDLITAQGESMKSGLATHGRQIESLATEVTTTRLEVVEQGKTLAQLQQTCSSRGSGCAARMAKQSEEIARLGGSVKDFDEVSEVIHIDQIRRKTIWWTLTKTAGVVVALVTMVIGAVSALHNCTP